MNVNQNRNPWKLYEHQIDAMAALNKIDKKKSFDAILVLPTGGGKTLTAYYCLLKNAYSDLLINNSFLLFE